MIENLKKKLEIRVLSAGMPIPLKEGDIFHLFYQKRDKAAPVSNPWNLNLGKLVVPNVFVEPLLIRELTKNYHLRSMIVRTVTGHILLDISIDAIAECFDLDKTTLTKVNRNRLE